MTVKELREQLSAFDDSVEVVINVDLEGAESAEIELIDNENGTCNLNVAVVVQS